jgi:cell division protein FtsW (lipid II flippase)/cell division protein FtsI/penicillin-binding protein 2
MVGDPAAGGGRLRRFFPSAEPWVGPRGLLALVVSAWVAFGALVVGLSFGAREGGVRIGDVVHDVSLGPSALVGQALVLGAAFLIGHLALRWAAPGSDPVLYAVVCLLSGIGWLYLSSLAPDLAAYQANPDRLALAPDQHLSILVGIAGCAVVAALGRAGLLRRLARYRYLMALLYLALLGANIAFGTKLDRGAIVLKIGSKSVQTIEIAKYLLMFFAAGYLAEASDWLRVGKRLSWRLVLPYLVLVGVALVPVAFGLGEVGPTALIGLAVLTLLYAGTRSAGLVAAIAGGGIGLGAIAYAAGQGRVVQRVDAFLHPFDHNLQIAQGVWAAAAGGWTGRGLTQTAAHRIPIAESDFAFAGWVEATGLAGGAVLILLFALLCWRGLEIARRARDRYEAGLALGLTAVLASQVLIIVAGNLAYAPLTGITVPFVSHGQLSLLTNFGAVGALLAISSGGGGETEHPWQRSLGTISLAWALMFGLLLVGLARRSVLDADLLTDEDFVNVQRVERLRKRVADGEVVEAGGALAVAPGVTSAKVGAALADLIDHGDIHLGPQGITVETSCCRITNPRRSAAAPSITRGRVLDAAGRPLAESVVVPGGRRHARVYPFGAALFPITGLSDPLLVDDTGAEAIFDEVLRGDAVGSPRRAMQRLTSTSDRGDDVQLTVDAGLSQLAWQLLAETGDGVGTTSTGRGAIVVLDGRSGDILAAVSRPAWDPNSWRIGADPAGVRWRQETDRDGWIAAGTDLGQRLRHSRAWDVRYPPGSTMKILLATAWLETGHDPEHRVLCRGRRPADARGQLPGCHPHSRFPEPDLAEALAASCNAWFGGAGLELGPTVLPLADAWGLNRSWDLATGLAGRRWPSLRSRAWQGEQADGSLAPWDDAFFRQNPKLVSRAAIGQATVELTPLQVALLGAAVANGGELPAPRLVSSLRVAPDPSRPGELGGVWAEAEAPPPTRVFSEDTAEHLREGLTLVLDEGTGHKLPRIVRMADGRHQLVDRDDVAAVDPDATILAVAGKSGTADVCDGCGIPPHAWFVAWAPADAKRGDDVAVVAAFVENGGTGNAASAAVQALAAALNLQAGRGRDPVPVDLREPAP